MQAGNSNNSDRDRRLAKQKEMIDKVVNWLKEEGVNSQDITHVRKDASYLARILTKQGKKTEEGKIVGEEGFHILFSKTKLDSITISELISLNQEDQQSYKSLGASQEGILQQNKFYFDLQLALHQKNVFFAFEKNIRELQSLEVSKGIFFDGLTKDRFFDVYFTVHSAIMIARIKLGQLRDEVLPSKAGRTDDSSGLK